MEMRKCEKGHYYDASVHSNCPYCNNVRNTEMTVAMGVAAPSAQGGQASPQYSNSSDLEKTVALGVEIPAANDVAEDNDKTVAMFRTDAGIDPAVGWLVHIDGKYKGKDYRIHSDNNYVGRADKMDIAIKGDDTISRDNHAIITYDSYENKFFFAPGEGRSLIRVNGKTILQSVELNAYDRILMGKSEFVFIPLCSEKFQWEKEQ